MAITVLPGLLTFTVYTQNRFSPAFYTYANNQDLLLDEGNGLMYQMADTAPDDNGLFILMTATSDPQDGGTNELKFNSDIEVIGDKVPDKLYLQYTDDDYQTFGISRPVALNAQRSQVRRCGRFRHRAFKISYMGAYQLRLRSLEVNVSKGVQ